MIDAYEHIRAHQQKQILFKYRYILPSIITRANKHIYFEVYTKYKKTPSKSKFFVDAYLYDMYLHKRPLEHRAQQEVGVRGPLQSLDLVEAGPQPALINQSCNL